VTVLAVIAATHGVSLIATVVLVTIYIYFMLGMLFYHALTGALVIFASYLVLARVLGLPHAEMLVDSGVLVFTNCPRARFAAPRTAEADCTALAVLFFCANRNTRRTQTPRKRAL
jgi:hypothetical protein